MRVSLVLPYWNRQDAADEALKSISDCYPDLDLEVVVVDDGSTPRFVPPDLPLDITIIRMPKKDDPKSPCIPWNVGVRQAEGDVVVLSCIEVIHTKPVIQELIDELVSIGKNGYVLGAARS
jgi:hypothetical protein